MHPIIRIMNLFIRFIRPILLICYVVIRIYLSIWFVLAQPYMYMDYINRFASLGTSTADAKKIGI
jgi:hypothetical protein